MAEVQLVRELFNFKGAACLVRRGSDYFVVSSVDALFTGPETLAFPADADGEPTSWLEVAGGRGVSRNEVIAELAAEPEPDDPPEYDDDAEAQRIAETFADATAEMHWIDEAGGLSGGI